MIQHPPRTLAIVTLAVALFCATFAVNLQAPLYRAYAAASGVGAGAVTIGFACYVAGLMPTLMFLGGLSDRIGRRIPLGIALGLGAAATALLVASPTFPYFCAARVLLGIGTALATTSGNAYMAELLGADRSKSAALIVTSATTLGFGSGALATGMSLGAFGPSTFPLSFAVLLISAPLLAFAVQALPRADNPRAVSMFRLPLFPAGTAIFGIAIALAWSVTGMTIAVVPLELAQRGLYGWTGAVVFLTNFVGFLCQPLARRMSNRDALMLGFLLIPLGFFVLVLGSRFQSLSLVLLGTAISSAACYGFTYLGGLAEFSDRAPTERARATAGYFTYAYVGFSLPVISSGFLADAIGLPNALMVYATALAAGCALTAMTLLRLPKLAQ